MAKHILDYSTFSLNLPFEVFDDLNESLNKAKALIHMAFSEQFIEAEPEIKNNYLWQLDDLVEKAICHLNAFLRPKSDEKE